MKKTLGIILLILLTLNFNICVFAEEFINENNNSNEITKKNDNNDELVDANTSDELNDNTVLENDSEAVIKKPNVYYSTHVQNVGWQKYVSNGQLSGTTGKSLRLEGIKIKLDNEPGSGDIEYKTHIQNIGWESSYNKNDQLSGTTGRSLRLEAIEIKLTGNIANYYDVYYRVHSENYGWLGWAKNGEKAGTAGFSYRLEGIEIKIVEKNNSFSDYGTKKAFRYKEVLYSTHISNYGWQDYAFNGNTSGTTGQSKRLEGIKIKLNNPDYSGNIEYKTHIENIGWESSYKKNDEISGTTGRSLRIEAIRIKLTGDIANHFDVYYRVHAENYGWLGWTKNDEIAGTVGYGYRLEAIQIQLVKKGDSAPGSTSDSNHLRYVRYRGYQSSWKSYSYDGNQNGSGSNPIESINMSLTNALYPGSINYSSYVTGSGWQKTVSNGTQTNNTGNKIEAIKVNLTGEVSNYYDVYYSVYVSSTGWTGWTTNNNPCGNIGNEKYIIAYKVKLVKKGLSPGDTNNTYTEAPMSIKYTTNVVGTGWQGYASDGATSGTTGQSTAIKGIKVKVNKKIPTGSVQYSTHVSNVGWQSYYTDNAQSGIQGKVEAIKIRLTGELANKYDIYYRVHVSNVGWMGWTSNDKPAGTVLAGLTVEAIEVKLVDKGGLAPENTNNAITLESYLEARWETDSNGNKYYYDIYGNMIKGGGYAIGSTTYYFGPSGIYLGTQNLQILDISAHQGVVDWNAVAHSGIYGVILRVAASAQYRDSRLKENVEGCKRYGIPYGIYIYSYAENYSEGQAYANFTKSLINEFDIHPTLGIFLDLEKNEDTQFMGPAHYEAVVRGFYSVIPNAEIYTYTNYADTALNTSYIRSKITWIADWRSRCYYTGSYKMWQYTSQGRNAGINGNVDKSILYHF